MYNVEVTSFNIYALQNVSFLIEYAFTPLSEFYATTASPPTVTSEENPSSSTTGVYGGPTSSTTGVPQSSTVTDNNASEQLLGNLFVILISFVVLMFANN